MFTFETVFKNAKRALFVTAHPDDTDVFFAGTISLLRKRGVDCYVQVLSSGGLGGDNILDRKLTRIREAEQLNSLKLVDIPSNNIELRI